MDAKAKTKSYFWMADWQFQSLPTNTETTVEGK